MMIFFIVVSFYIFSIIFFFFLAISTEHKNWLNAVDFEAATVTVHNDLSKQFLKTILVAFSI